MRYSWSKASKQGPERLRSIKTALVEIGFVVFLFYSNLLIGEFTRANGRGKTLAFALADIFSQANLGISLVAGLIGYLIFDHLRKRL